MILQNVHICIWHKFLLKLFIHSQTYTTILVIGFVFLIPFSKLIIIKTMQ